MQSKAVVRSRAFESSPGVYTRIADSGKIIGNASLKQGGGKTTWIVVHTDVKGNLITAYPVANPR